MGFSQGFQLTTEQMEHLSDLKETARQAFYWNSFDPEKSGNRILREHEEQLQSDLENIPETEKERYIENYRKYFIKWLNALSNCASSAVTGGANFNVSRAEKANRREHDVYGEFIEWRERALNAIAKKVEDAKPESQKIDEAWRRLEKDILHSAVVIDGVNKGIERGYNKALFVSSIYGKVETYAKRGDVEIVNRAIDCIRKFNETMGVVITERHKFFKLPEMAQRNKEATEELSNKENQEQPFNGGIVVFNYQEDRLQLLFDEKPSYEIIQQLKKNAFRWSPRFGAWQRQLTNNAVFTTKQFLSKNNLNCQ